MRHSPSKKWTLKSCGPVVSQYPLTYTSGMTKEETGEQDRKIDLFAVPICLQAAPFWASKKLINVWLCSGIHRAPQTPLVQIQPLRLENRPNEIYLTKNFMKWSKCKCKLFQSSSDYLPVLPHRWRPQEEQDTTHCQVRMGMRYKYLREAKRNLIFKVLLVTEGS